MGDAFSKGSVRQADAEDRASYERMLHDYARLPVPVMQRRDNPNQYLFFALFDGTGQDVDDPKQSPTNVGWLHRQAEEAERDPSKRIGQHYVKGIGTQERFAEKWLDRGTAFSWDERIEEMYLEASRQAFEWKKQNPQAEINVVGIGYSRGGVLVPGFNRLVDEYGIAHPDGLKFGRDQYGNITVESSRPPLMPPRQVAQAVALFDPVATGFPENYDARLPGSVISGVGLLAEHEGRRTFSHQAIIDTEMTHDGRFYGVKGAGGHSNAGGGNAYPGLEILAGNAMVEGYLNRLSENVQFQTRPVPDDPALFQIYQVRGMTAGFGLAMDRDGERNVREELANCKIVDPCRDSEPLNLDLARKFERRYLNGETAPSPDAPPLEWPSMPAQIGVQPSLRGPGARRSGDDAEQSQESVSAGPQAQAFPADHRDIGLFLALRAQLPASTSDEKVAETLLQAKRNGIRSETQLDQVMIQDGQAYVMGKTPGDWTRVSLSSEPPSMADALRSNATFDKQREEELGQFLAWQEQINLNPTGPVMRMGGPSLRMGPAPQQDPVFTDASAGDGGGGGDG